MTFLAEGALFLKTWIKQPIRTGAIAPSGNALAKLITSGIEAGAGPVIELGPGTGAFTRSILARGVAERDLVLVERSPDFARLL
ncbi:MAG: phospholipid methyltransferase, partial [Hydrogenophaga sp.]